MAAGLDPRLLNTPKQALRVSRDPGQLGRGPQGARQAQAGGFAFELSPISDAATSLLLDSDGWFDPKRRASEEPVAWLRGSMFARYHGDPCWQRLMRKAGFAPEQVR